LSIDSIIKKAIKGDEESFVSLIQARQEKIYRIAYSYVKNQQDAWRSVRHSPEMTIGLKRCLPIR
jgi:RNA polymerase sigma-70 factor (ECF subfamily)